MGKLKKILILVITMVMIAGVCAMAACDKSSSANEEATLQQQIAELKNQIEEQNDRMKQLEEEKEKLNTQISDLEEENESRDSKINALESANKELLNKVYLLELQLRPDNFYTLQEAYDLGLITQADLMSIAYYHNDGRKYNSDLMDESYQPVEKLPEQLSESQKLSIKQAFINKLNDLFSNQFELENIGICAYNGTYNGYVAVELLYLVDGMAALNTVIYEETVDNVKFFYPEYTSFFGNAGFTFNNSIMIWKEN